MKEALHTMIAEDCARWLGWPDPDAVGKGAALPDQIEIFTVPGIGRRFAGCNLSSLTHFSAYNLGMDRSLGRLELPNVDIRYIAGAWPGIPLGLESQDPLYQLLQVKGYTHAFDEITFPAAWSYADWFERCFIEAAGVQASDARERDRMLCSLAGCALHYVQDLCVPHHRWNMLLRGHARFEAKCLERWESMPRAERDLWVNDECGKAPRWSARGAAQGLMVQPGDVPGYRYNWSCFPFPRKLVDGSIRTCVRVTAAVLQYMKGYLS